MAIAAIFGVEQADLTKREAAFFREADPWGFILFARNIVGPRRLAHLVDQLREAVGRNAPVLVDQEGGRVQRLGPPHWRGWRDVLHLDAAPGGSIDSGGAAGEGPPAKASDEAGEERILEALWLRYRIIADELFALGIDVNCAPVLDVPTPGGHEIIGTRALGHDPAKVARRGRAVCEGLLAGGVLPVIKHLPGHGRADVDSHLALPHVAASHDELARTDFLPFRTLADQLLGMTAHVVYDALDLDRPATLSPLVIDLIRREIGFDGLLMTDDLSMQALSGPMPERAGAALAAGCDMLLHCNGDMAEMQAIAEVTPALSGEAEKRAARAEAARSTPQPIDIVEAFTRYRELTGEAPNG